jgi:hypothetical protein
LAVKTRVRERPAAGAYAAVLVRVELGNVAILRLIGGEHAGACILTTRLDRGHVGDRFYLDVGDYWPDVNGIYPQPQPQRGGS